MAKAKMGTKELKGKDRCPVCGKKPDKCKCPPPSEGGVHVRKMKGKDSPVHKPSTSIVSKKRRGLRTG